MSHYAYPSPYYVQPQQYYEPEQQWENVYCKPEPIAEIPMAMYYDPLPSPPYTPTYTTTTQQSYFSPMESYIPRTEPLEASWSSTPITGSPSGSTHSCHSLPTLRVDAVEGYERRSSDINIVYGNYTHASVLQPPIQLNNPVTRIPIIEEIDLERPEEICKPFIMKLSYLLSNPELFSTLIQWDVSGRSFILAPSENFIDVLSDIFSHRSLPAFYRQLKTYNFTHLTTKALSETFQYSPDSMTPIKELSAWSSPYFRRDKPELMVRLCPRLSKARLQQRKSKMEANYSVESRGRCYSGLKMGRTLSH